jgi:hypothetical protein
LLLDLLAPASCQAADLSRDHASDPRLTLAWIQTNLERVGAGAPPLQVDAEGQGVGLESIITAYAHFLQGDSDLMNADLARVDAAAKTRSERLFERWDERQTDSSRKSASYLSDLDNLLSKDASDLLGLLVRLRKVGGILFLEAANSGRASAEERRPAYFAGPLADSWLRLPCVTVIGRGEALAVAASTMGRLAGPLLSCPTREEEFPVLAALALDPERFHPKPEPDEVPAPSAEATTRLVPSLPWDYETAIAYMADNPEAAEEILESAAYSDAVGALDYALFLQAFRRPSAERDAKIRALTDALLNPGGVELDSFVRKPTPYDGSDQSLADITEFASSQGIANTASAFYAIPCAVLIARPGLLAAIGPRYGSNRDNFTPRSGCAWGRGEVEGFPSQSVAAFEGAATGATGNFLGNHTGTLRFAHYADKNAVREQLKVHPAGFLRFPGPEFDFPYQLWGDLGLDNRHVSRRIRDLYTTAKQELIAYNMNLGLDREQAAHAAAVGLFQLTFGGDCGGRMPEETTRGMLMDRVALTRLAPRLAQGEDGEASEVKDCSADADADPLSQVAVVHPEALAFMLERGMDVDEENAFGKTPLMAAAQFDRIESTRLLIARGASVNNVTRQEGTLTLYHDGRSALMYAAANASLPMIELLLEAGADPYQTDTKGARAVHYLLGYGPERPANPKLTPEEWSRAIQLLF